jgi:hypothetical protein
MYIGLAAGFAAEAVAAFACSVTDEANYHRLVR